MDDHSFTVGIASPCNSSWEDMHGDDKHRFCHRCQQFVHDLDALNEEEKIELIRKAQIKDPHCARIYARKDGKVLDQDCPVGASGQVTEVNLKMTRKKTLCLGVITAACIAGGYYVYAILTGSP